MNKDLIIKKIASFGCDCFPDGKDCYFSEGTRVTHTEVIGKYLETDGSLNSEFGFRFKVNNIRAPHLCVISYPDDKKRYMGVSNCFSYDLSTGICTGGVYPLSGEIKQVEFVFWPRGEIENVSFITMNAGDPAALVGCEVYELSELPEERLPNGAEFRKLGIQFEDPCGRCSSLGAHTFSEWNERLIKYMKSSGQNELYYPVNWYHGPIYPSEIQPADMFDVISENNKKQYCRATTKPFDWVEELLCRLDKENMFFSAAFTLVRLGTLMRDMVTDENAVYSGTATYNNIRGNGKIQNAVNDWTIVYNTRSLPALLEKAEKNGGTMNFRDIDLAYGERMSEVGIGPMFNPIHPTVKNAVKEYLCEFASRYGGHKSLRCISINVWHSSLMWFGSLDFGYDDYTVGLFEKERGISLEIPENAAERFSHRKEILLKKYKKEWVTWRCEKITDNVKEIKAAIFAVNPRVRLAINFWNEMVKPSIFGGIGKFAQLYERGSDVEFLRAAGMDLTELGKIDGLEICVENNHQRDITNLFTRNGEKAAVERGYMYRDFDFMDDERTAALKNAANPTAFVFNCWEESWGNVKARSCGEEMRKKLPYDDGSVPEIIYEQTSDKHNEKFWYDWQIVIVSAFPPAPFYMEYYAHSIADYDAFGISSGGLYVDTAHTTELLNFAKEYRYLPCKKFNDAKGSGDPFTVRSIFYGEKTYIYAVNKSPVCIKGKICFCSETEYERPSVGQKKKGNEIKEYFAPFELKVYTSDAPVEILGVDFSAQDARAGIMERSAREMLTLIENSRADLKGNKITAEKLRKAIKNKEYSAIYHIMTGYVAAKAKENGENALK